MNFIVKGRARVDLKNHWVYIARATYRWPTGCSTRLKKLLDSLLTALTSVPSAAFAKLLVSAPGQ